MNDKQILDLYWARSEDAISETSKRYGRYYHYIARNILHNDEDSEECVNDIYLKAWESKRQNHHRRGHGIFRRACYGGKGGQKVCAAAL